MNIPFEDLDIHFGEKIVLEQDSLFFKIVSNKRGGFCYELNYLFYKLLTNVGFDCCMVSSRIKDNEGYGPPFDHMSIIVKLDDNWLVDVGYGDLFIEPIKISTNSIQKDDFKDYKIEKLNDNEFVLLESHKGVHNFIERYIFDCTPRSIEDFFAQCEYKQSSADSYFVQNMICTIPTQHGRKTIFNNVYKTKSLSTTTEEIIQSNDDLIKILSEEFNTFLI
jgi:N-hydroxyarylamine O-acetyltransferase